MAKSPVPILAGVCQLRPGLAVIATLLLFLPTGRADESLARAVPGDVGLFVELRRGDDLLVLLTEPQTWLTVAEFAGQPARLDEAAEWRRRVEQTVHMPPDVAVRTLFSQRVAFVGAGLGRAQDAVVLCRPASDPRELIQAWQARPLPTTGATSVYRLINNIGLGLHDHLLIFGDAGAGEMFPQVLRVLDTSGAPTLADDPVYQRLLARVPADPDGVFYVRLTNPAAATAPSATAPATAAPATTAPLASAPTATAPVTTRPVSPQLPSLLRGSSRLLLALHREGPLLRFSAVGDGPPGITSPRAASLADVVDRLPERTLLAWAGHVDYQTLPQAMNALPERHVLRVAFQIQQEAFQRLTAALNSATCLAVGIVSPESRQVSAPPVPALAVLVTARNPAAAAAEWSTLLHDTLAVYKLLSLKGTATRPLPPVEKLDVDGAQMERLNLSPLISEDPAQTAFGEIHLCWALDGDVLILASHSDWLRQVLAARHGSAPGLAGLLALTRRPSTEQRDNVFLAQTGPLADLGALWLQFFAQTAPQVLNENWWRAYQPGGHEVRLGIQVTEEPQRNRLKVQSVTPNMPAEGLVKPGDEIIGCSGRDFATSQPLREITRALTERPDARWIDLRIERDGNIGIHRIPLPFVDPIQVLRRLVAIGRIVQRAVYSEDTPDAAGPRGYLTLELRSGPAPLFPLLITPAVSPTSSAAGTAPAATAPAPRPASTPPAPASQPAATTPVRQPAGE